MPFTPSLINTWPTVNASANTWGGTLNSRGAETYTDMQAIASVLNPTELKAIGALQTSGGTMTGDLVLPSIVPTSTLSAGYRGLPQRSVTATTTIVSTDAGGEVMYQGTGAATVTIPNINDVGLALGTVIAVRNFSGYTLSVNCAAGVQLRVPLSPDNANRSIAPWGQSVIKMEKPNEWVIVGSGVS